MNQINVIDRWNTLFLSSSFQEVVQFEQFNCKAVVWTNWNEFNSVVRHTCTYLFYIFTQLRQYKYFTIGSFNKTITRQTVF